MWGTLSRVVKRVVVGKLCGIGHYSVTALCCYACLISYLCEFWDLSVQNLCLSRTTGGGVRLLEV